MFINRTVKAGFADQLTKPGKLFTMIASSGTVIVALYKQGKKLLETELTNGLTIKDIDFDRVETTSNIDQTVRYWVSRYAIDIAAQDTPVTKTLASKISSPPGVFNLAEPEAARDNLRVKSDFGGFYVGGDDMDYQGGEVVNGVRIAQGEEIVLKSTGVIKAFVKASNNYNPLEVNELVEYPVHTVNPSGSYQSGTANDTTVQELLDNNVPYMEIDIPPELHNQTISWWFRFSKLAGNSQWRRPTFLVQEGEGGTETEFFFIRESMFSSTDDGLWVNVQAPQGKLKVWVVDEHDLPGNGQYSDTGLRLLELYTTAPALSSGLSMRVIEEVK